MDLRENWFMHFICPWRIFLHSPLILNRYIFISNFARYAVIVEVVKFCRDRELPMTFNYTLSYPLDCIHTHARGLNVVFFIYCGIGTLLES